MTTSNFGGTKPKMSNKRRVVLFAVGGAIGLGGFIWYKKHSASSGGGSSAGSTGDQGIDPATGVPYSDEYGGMDGAYGTVPGADGTYNPLSGTYTPGYGSTGQVTTPGNNAEWSQAAIKYLTDQGYDPLTVTTAIGAYLIGAPLTTDQVSIVQAALAVEGQPPGGAPPIHHAPAPGQGGTSGRGLKVTVPKVTGMRTATGVAKLVSVGLIPHLNQNTPRGKRGTISSQRPAAGQKVNVGTTVNLDNRIA